MNAAPRLFILGDSITLGVAEMVNDEVRTRVDRTFVDHLRERFADWHITTDAAVHRSTTEALRLLPALLAEHRPDLVWLPLGGNDVDISWKRFILTAGRRVRPNTPVIQFEQNFRTLIAAIRTAGAQPLLSDLPIHNLPERARHLSAVTGQDVGAMLDAIDGWSASERQYAEYAAALDRVAADTDTLLARWATAPDWPEGPRHGPDGTHPGEAAHAQIARVVGDSLERLIDLPTTAHTNRNR